MIERILGSTRAHWREVFPDGTPPTDFRFTLQSRRRIIFFLFDPSSPISDPMAVVKVSRTLADNAVLEQSLVSLAAVRLRLSRSALLETVPLAVALEPVRGLSASLERALPGDPMSLSGGAPWSAHSNNWEAWRRWLLGFQRATAAPPEILSQFPIDQTIGYELTEGLSWRDLGCINEKLNKVPMGIAWRVGDAHHSNILIQKRAVSGFVDWEGAGPFHWVVNDWLHFAFQYFYELYRAREKTSAKLVLAQRAIDALVNPPTTPMTEMARSQTIAFLASHDLSPDLLLPLLLLFVAGMH